VREGSSSPGQQTDSIKRRTVGERRESWGGKGYMISLIASRRGHKGRGERWAGCVIHTDQRA